MTICVAANCAKWEAVVVASDRMLSAPFLTLEFDHPDAKIEEISPTCVALTAGDALASQDVLAGGIGHAGQLQNPFMSDFTYQIRQRFVEARRRLASEQLLEPRDMSFADFYQNGGINRLPPDLAMLLDNSIQKLALEVSIILAGIDRSGPHVYGIEDPGTSSCYDRLGYHAIGSGHRHALLTLVGLNQHHSVGLNHTVFAVYCAKKAAELAPGVGQSTEMRVIPRNGIRVLTADELDQLSPSCEQRIKPKLDEVDKVVSTLPYESKGTSDDSGQGSAKPA